MATKTKRRSATKTQGKEREDTPLAPENSATSAEPEPDEEGEVDALEPNLNELDADLGDIDLSPDLPELGEGDADREDGHGRGRARRDGGRAQATSRELALAPIGRSERALAPYDAMAQYITEIRRYPLLSREEEHELAVHYVNTRDVDAARRLITANLRLVVKIAHEYRRAYRNLLDLVQEGNVGLLQAVNKYDPYRGVKLSSYAAWWIRAYILKFILNNWRLVKIGTTQAQRKLFFNLRKEKEALEREGFAPEAKLLAERLEVSEQDVTDMEKRLGLGEQSLDAPLSYDEDGKRSQIDLLEASGELRPDVATEADEFRKLLRDKLDQFAATLRGRELTIFKERLDAEAPLTLQEIGDRYGISRERARQLEKRLTVKLRDHLRKELGDAVEIAMGMEEE